MVRLTFVLVVMLNALNSYSQQNVYGEISTSNSISNVERNFTGFNSSQGYLENIYKINYANSGLEVNNNFHEIFKNLNNNISWRFPGGTAGNFYNRWASGFGNAGFGVTFGDDWNYANISIAALKTNYANYYNYNVVGYPNSKANIIFPFINSISKNKTTASQSAFCINIINHYRSSPLIGYDSRRETLRDTNKVIEIINLKENYLDAFNNSTLSNNFKKIVLQNIDAYLTLISNGVTVNQIEMGNEIFSYVYDDNLFTDYNTFFYNSNFFSPSDNKVWIRPDDTNKSNQEANSTLWTYARLAKMYKVLIIDTLQKLSNEPQNNLHIVYENHLNNIKFGIPISVTSNGGFRIWDNFMLNPEVSEFIGTNAYIMHPYFDNINFLKGVDISAMDNTNKDKLSQEFNAIRDTLEIAYNQRFFRENQVELINKLPNNAEVWYTEWNFNFDNNNLKKVGNTLLHAMYYYDVIMNFFDINANKNLATDCNKTNPIKLCNYQLPYAKKGTWYNMTRFKDGYKTKPSDPYNTTNIEANSIEYYSTYYAALLLSPILKDSTIQYLNNTNGGFDNILNCSFRSFYKKDCSTNCCRNDIYIYFNNKSDSDYSINLSKTLELDMATCVNTTSNYLYANNLFASMGETTFRTDGILHTDTANAAADITIQRVFNQKINTENLDNVLIPKYALGYIKVSSNDASSNCECTSNSRKKPNTNEDLKIVSDEKITRENSIKIYPNPSYTGNINLNVYSNRDVTSDIRIFDITGNLVKSFQRELFSGDNILQLDLVDLAKATYIIHVTGNEIKFSSKIILQ